MKRFADLSEQEVLALAVSNEDEDNRIYRSFADGLRGSYPDTAAMYDKMAEEEIGHRDMSFYSSHGFGQCAIPSTQRVKRSPWRGGQWRALNLGIAEYCYGAIPHYIAHYHRGPICG